MKCQKCGLDNPNGARFCNRCGIPLAQSRVDIEHYSMVQRSIPEELRGKIASASIEGERKHVTVLFADISGFTALSEKLDPEDLTDLVNRCFKGLIAIIFRYEGTIDKFIGDCIMAIFGAPVAHEDDPERAVHAALDILSAIDHFNEENKTILSIHIGIHSGEVVAGGIGSDLRMDYTVMGDTVNLASRLMDLAKDEILVSEALYRKLEHKFELQGMKPVKVKGKTRRVKPYRIVGIKEPSTGKRGKPELRSPFVGRAQELEKITKAVAQVCEGTGHAIAVVGDAGIGKSRLIEEMRRQGEGSILWLQGRSSSYGKALPFGVILEQLRTHFGIDVRDQASRAMETVAESSVALFGETTDKYLPYLLSFLSISVPKHLENKVKYLDMVNLHLQEFVAIKALYRSISKRIPLILYFEDVQWMDSESVRLLEFLLDGLRDVRILFLFETRSSKESAFFLLKPLIRKLYGARYTDICLKPLDAHESGRLLENYMRVGEYPGNLSRIILDKSEGNPFYIEEIVRSLADAGRLKGSREMRSSEQESASFEVPETVEAVIRSRIDNLPFREKEVLGNASVIGRTFYSPILAYLSAPEEVEASLGILESCDFIQKERPKGEEEHLEEPALKPGLYDYSFKHTLIREVTYHGILKKKRRRVHGKIAEFIEQKFGSEIERYYETLAIHCFHADQFERSYSYYRKAGEAAKRLYLHSTAIERLKKAIELHKRLFPSQEGDLAELFESMGDAQVIQANYQEALKSYEEALKKAHILEKKAEITMKKGDVLSYISEYDEAISTYEKTIRMVEGKPLSAVYFDTLLNFAALLSLRKSDHERAERMTRDVLAKMNVGKEQNIRAKAFNNLGVISYNKGDYDQALRYYGKTLEIFEKLNNKRGIAACCRNMGVAYSYKGELDRSLEYYKKHLEISDEIGDRREIGSALNNIGIVYWNKGMLDTALGYYQRHLSISEEIGDKRGIGAAHNNIGLILWKQGDFEKALKSYKRYLAISEEIGFKIGIGKASGNIGGVYHYKGELDTALTYYKRHLEIAEEIGIKQEIGVAMYNIGCVYRDKGEFDKALEFFDKYRTTSRMMGYKLGDGYARAGLGNVYQELGKYSEAKRLYEEAEGIIGEIGDKVLLANIYAYQAELKIGLQDFASGRKLAKKALALAREAKVQAQEIPALRALGKATFAKDQKQGLHYLKQSVSLARTQMMQYELAVSLYEMAYALAKHGMKDEARMHIQEAKEILKRAGAKYWMGKIKELEEGIL